MAHISREKLPPQHPTSARSGTLKEGRSFVRSRLTGRKSRLKADPVLFAAAESSGVVRALAVLQPVGCHVDQSRAFAEEWAAETRRILH